MGTAQVMMVVLLAAALATHLIRNGQEIENTKLQALFINLPIMVGLLYWGGFFVEIAAPQVIMIVIITINMVLALGGEAKNRYNFAAALADTPITVGLLWWGGFWG